MGSYLSRPARARPPRGGFCHLLRHHAYIELVARPSWRSSDLARAELIRDLMQDLGVNDEGASVILNRLDQMYGLRRALVDAAIRAPAIRPTYIDSSMGRDQDHE